MVLEYLRIEGFFTNKTRKGPGRPTTVSEESVLMGIVSYYSTSLSLLQCSFSAGKDIYYNKESVPLHYSYI